MLFWNIWLDNQIYGKNQAEEFLSVFERIIEQYQPDCIGLTEVLQHAKSSSPFVLDFLKDFGYKNNHFTQAAPISDDWILGSTLSSRLDLKSTKDVMLSKNNPAIRRGYKGHNVNAITTEIVLPNNEKVSLIVAHPLYLALTNIAEHYRGTNKLKKLLKTSEFLENTIIAGDFNEPSIMPRSFSTTTSRTLHSRTGTYLHPTWRHHASHSTLIKANLDRIYWTKKGSLRLIDFEVIKTDVSDHRPLFAKFKT